jgi:tetratricopeptide (TPR) repeat protein
MATIRKSIPFTLTSTLVALCVVIAFSGCTTLGRSSALTPAEHLNLAIAYEYDGKLDLALREYERAAVGAMRSRARTGQGNVFASREQWSEAESSYRAALKADPDNVFALNNLAWLLAQQNRLLDEAEQLIRHAIDQAPDSIETYWNTLDSVLEAQKTKP